MMKEMTVENKIKIMEARSNVLSSRATDNGNIVRKLRRQIRNMSK